MIPEDSTPATRISATPLPHAAPGEAPSPAALRLALGETDVYLLDQILRGRIEPGMTVLDAGSGPGRNVHERPGQALHDDVGAGARRVRWGGSEAVR